MDYFCKIDEIMDNNNGFLVTDAVTKANIPRVYIKDMLDRGDIVKAERGIYLKKGTADDELYRTQLKYKGVIYSHETALILHGILKKNKESKVMVTVKTGLNPTRLKDRGLKVFTLQDSLMGVGEITMKTPNGNEVRTYDLERTICDMVRSRNQVDDKLFARALNAYFRSDRCDEKKLYEMADKFHITKILNSYKKVIIL